MKVIAILLGIVALGTAGSHHPNPVYYRVPSAVSTNGSPLPAGKSLPLNSGSAMSPPITDVQPAQMQMLQPIAEARESVYTGQDPSQEAPAGSQNGGPPQTFNILYYPNAGPLDGQATYPASMPYTPDQQVSTWNKLRLTDVSVAVLTVGLLVAGGFMIAPSVKEWRSGRALPDFRTLVTSDDVSRMARTFFKAIEKYQQVNAVDVE